jgi:hypothetical protein
MFRKNTGGQTLGFALASKSTGDALTGATVSVYRCIDGGAQASATGTVAEKGNGQYVFSPSAADLNGNQVSFLFVATGAIPEEKTVVTTAADPTDAQRLGLTALPASGTLAIKPAVTLAAVDVAGNLPANMLQVAGQTANASGAVTFPSAIGTSTYAGADTAGTTTLLSRVTAAVALAGSAPSWYTAPTTPPTTGQIAAAILATPANLLATSATGAVNLNLTQSGLSPRALDAVADGSLTVGDALVCAVVGAAGKETVVGTAYTVKTPSTGTVIRTFTLDSASTPTSRT